MTGPHRTFKLPDDLPRAHALGEVYQEPLSEAQIRKRLDFISRMIQRNLVPDVLGREARKLRKGEWYQSSDGTKLSDPDSRSLYKAVPPPELSGHMDDLATAVERVKELMHADQLEDARARSHGLDSLIDEMCERVAQGARLREAGRKRRRRKRSGRTGGEGGHGSQCQSRGYGEDDQKYPGPLTGFASDPGTRPRGRPARS